MSTSISAYATRDEIKNLVTLLCLTSDQDNPYIDIDSTTVNGEHENPVTVQRAYRECADKAAEDDFKPGQRPELFDTDHDFDTDEVTVTPIEEHDPKADQQTALEIVLMLITRFNLRGESCDDLLRQVLAIDAPKARLGQIAEAHCKDVGELGLTSGMCMECGYSWPCPTYVWASTERDPLATWNPADDEQPEEQP